MERSLVARVAAPLGLPALRRPGGSRAKTRPARRASSGAASGTRLADRLRAGLALLWRGRRSRIALIVAILAVPVLGGGFLALRHSSFVAVRDVRVNGVHGAEAPAIEASLRTAARHMSTLDVNIGALRAAVAPFRVVSGLRALPSFPHGLRIEVEEQLPVAALVVDGSRTAVAADGVVLGPALLSSALPMVTGYIEPAAGQRLHSGTLLESLAVLGAAPRSLAEHIERVYSGPQGLTVAMRNGLLAYFGDAVRPHAKWLSLARVLADRSSAGASYVDVRLPARPAAGFPAGAGPASAESASGESTESSESAVGALAAGLSKEGGTSSTSGEPSASSSSEPAGTTSEADAGEASETPSSSGSEASHEAPAAGG